MAQLAPVYRYVGNRLRAMRSARGLTQADVAEAIGRGPEYISAVERGRKRIQLEDLAKAAEALDATLGELLVGITLRVPARGRSARERTARYNDRRTPPSPEAVTTLAQLATALDAADVGALTSVAQRMLTR